MKKDQIRVLLLEKNEEVSYEIRAILQNWFHFSTTTLKLWNKRSIIPLYNYISLVIAPITLNNFNQTFGILKPLMTLRHDLPLLIYSDLPRNELRTLFIDSHCIISNIEFLHITRATNQYLYNGLSNKISGMISTNKIQPPPSIYRGPIDAIIG